MHEAPADPRRRLSPPAPRGLRTVANSTRTRSRAFPRPVDGAPRWFYEQPRVGPQSRPRPAPPQASGIPSAHGRTTRQLGSAPPPTVSVPRLHILTQIDVPGVGRPDGTDELLGRLFLHHVAGRPGPNRPLRVDALIVHRAHHNLHLGPSVLQGPNSLHAVRLPQGKIHHRNVGLEGPDPPKGFVERLALATQGHAQGRLHPIREGLPDHGVVIHDEELELAGTVLACVPAGKRGARNGGARTVQRRRRMPPARASALRPVTMFSGWTKDARYTYSGS